MSENPLLLPLGSAVNIEDADGTFMIIARGFQKSPEGFLAGYKVVQHPRGAAPGVKEAVVTQTQIIKVVHRGWENAEDAEFAKKQLATAKAPSAAPAPVAEPKLTIDLSQPAARAPATPRPKTGEEASSGGLSNPKDPFSELRRKGKRK